MEHDNSYKLLFSEPQIVTDLLQGFVDEPWVGHLDFATLEKIPTQCVSDDLRDREDDVIWRLKCSDIWLYVYVLIEFQSTVDYFMAVRLMTYIGLLYQDLIKQQKLGKRDKLPPVFPIVLYNGHPRWTAATELNPLKNLVAAIFRLENAKTHEDMIAVIDDLLLWLTHPEQASIRRAFNIWIKRVLRASGKVTEALDHVKDLNEVRTMLAETIANWSKEWEAKGEAKGRIKGEAKGRIKGEAKGRIEGYMEARVQMLQHERLLFKRMINKRFGSAIAESAWEFLQTIEDSEGLAQVGDWLLDCATGEDFLRRLK